MESSFNRPAMSSRGFAFFRSISKGLTSGSVPVKPKAWARPARSEREETGDERVGEGDKGAGAEGDGAGSVVEGVVDCSSGMGMIADGDGEAFESEDGSECRLDSGWGGFAGAGEAGCEVAGGTGSRTG